MKVEKINSNKAKITLTFDELKEKEITLNEIKNDRLKAENFFLELLEDTQLIEEFEADSNQLLIEACKEDGLFTITITKAGDIPYVPADSKSGSYDVVYKISSNIYSFSNINNLKDFAYKASLENLYTSDSSLFYFNNKLFLVFPHKTTRNPLFVKTFSVLSEYADRYYSNKFLNDMLLEHGTLLFSKKNINQILEYPYFLT